MLEEKKSTRRCEECGAKTWNRFAHYCNDCQKEYDEFMKKTRNEKVMIKDEKLEKAKDLVDYIVNQVLSNEDWDAQCLIEDKLQELKMIDNDCEITKEWKL